MNVAIGNGIDNVKPLAGGFTQVAVSDTASSVLAAIDLDGKTTHLFCQCKGKSLVERLDGTAPTASIGIVRELGEKWVWTRAEAQAAQVISTDASGSTLNVQQYRDQ